MTVLQVSALAIVALCGTAIVLNPSPLRQTLLMAILGFALTALFFAFQAPDVALSELVVSGIALPLIVLSALRRLADQNPEGRGKESSGAQAEPPTQGKH